jgi:hypothetical protein
MEMSLREWLTLIATAAAAIIGLLLAASGDEGTTYTIGLGLIVAAVIYAFAVVKRYFDRVDRARG